MINLDLSEKTESSFRHPWELSRTEIILRELKKLNISGNVLDIGCGDAYFDDMLLKRFPRIKELWGVDICAKKDIRNGKANYVNSYEKIAGKKFRFVLLMDVLEHIEDDISFMNNLQEYLDENAKVLITVPAFQRLYSLHDKQLKHFRRYSYKLLSQTLTKSGYYVTDHSYFFLSLIPLRILSKNTTQNIGTWNYSEKSLITRMIRYCLDIDYTVLRAFSKLGISIGGLSLLAICQSSR